MTTNINLIISLILLILIIVYNIFLKKKYNNSFKSEIYTKTKKIKIILYIVSIIMFFVSLIINILIYGIENNLNTTITYIINALSITILFMPLSLSSLYEKNFKDEEKYSHKKTIITNLIDLKYIKKFNKAGINVIILTEEETDLKIKKIEESEIEKKYLSKNIIIKTSNRKSIDKLIIKEDVYYEFNDLSDAYKKIYHARGVHDNYVRTLKYLITTYLPLFLSYIFLNIISFPIYYNILLIIILKIFTIISSNYLYKNLPYDIDLMKRKPKSRNIIFGSQELAFTILESFLIFFMLNIPYMFVQSQGGTQAFANTLFYVIFIYSNLFITYSYLSEANIIKNIFKSLKNIRMIIFTIICILISLLFNFTTYFNTRNIELHNFIACISFGLISVLLNELIKLARFTTTKGKKKNDSKNNKKHK